MKEEVFDNDEILKIVTEIIIIKEIRYENNYIKDLKKENPDEIETLKELYSIKWVKMMLKFQKQGFLIINGNI